MGKTAVDKMAASRFFDGIDVVIAVPLHRDRQVERGYNQAQMIARGIAEACGAIEIEGLKATRPHSTQTRKGAYERWLNTRDTVAPNERQCTCSQASMCCW